MKKLAYLLLVIVFAAGCKNKQQTDFTIIGEFTPYQTNMEKLIGKVEKVTEINYWAVPDGESFKKGAKMTKKQLDSLGYTGDFEATFDNAGRILSCATLDENKKITSLWAITRESEILATANFTSKDTLRLYEKVKYDKDRNMIEATDYRSGVDTLLERWVGEKSAKGDTIVYKQLNHKGEVEFKYVLLYNDLKQFLGFQGYDKDGKYMSGNATKFDNMGKMSELVYFDKDKKPLTENIFINEYDSRGNWVKQICKDKKGFTIIGERVYKYFE
jgi:soluble cytochrome b562